MGLFDLFKNKYDEVKNPVFYNEHADYKIKELDYLIDRVGDDQKEILEKEKKYVKIGLDGEKNVIYELNRNRDSIVFLHDITLENFNHDSQIDFIVITRKGIIVLETKLLVGDITIDSEGNFIRYFKNVKGEVYKKEGIYSPITQNKYHCDAIDRLLQDNRIKNIPLYSLVVIANPKTILNKTKANPYIKNMVIKYDQLNQKINEIINNSTINDISYNTLINLAELFIKNDTERKIDYVSKFHLKLKEKDEIIESKEIDEEKKDIEVIENKSDNDILYEKLKKYRYLKSKEENTKPYMIFNNEELENIILSMPKTKEEFLKVKGFGEVKYNKYGIDIIKIINEDNLNKEDNALEKELKYYRFNKAKELNLKPYMIFNNVEMEELLKACPKTIDDLLKVKGFGSYKVEQYGEDIIKIINKH